MEGQELYVVAANGQVLGMGTQPITRLSALETLFAATGTVAVKVGTGLLTLPIQSVDTEEAEALARPYRPKVPTKSFFANNRWVLAANEADQDYQDRLAEYNRIVSYIWVLMALAVDITDEQGAVVWSADNRLHDLEAARRVLKRMRMVDTHLIAIMRAARDLTAFEEDQRLGE